MKTPSYFIVVKTPNEEPMVRLHWGIDIFDRPMPWGVWFRAVRGGLLSPWRFVRVSGVKSPLTQHIVTLEDDEIVFDDDRRFALEVPTFLTAILWGVEAVFTGTALKFWKWPCFRGLRARLKRWL